MTDPQWPIYSLYYYIKDTINKPHTLKEKKINKRWQVQMLNDDFSQVCDNPFSLWATPWATQ